MWVRVPLHQLKLKIFNECKCGGIFHRYICYSCGEVNELTSTISISQRQIKSLPIKKITVNVRPNSKRESVYKRDNFKCLKCGSKNNLTLDHILAKSKGGNNDVDNLQTLCFDCNQEKKTEFIDYRIK